MTSVLQKYTAEDSYLSQTRDLVLKAISGIDCTVFLFGSRARGIYRRSSDIDIGFSNLSELFTKLRDHLLAEFEESVITHHIDLVNMDAASSDFRDVAMEEAVVWKQ
jgi:predicted nucleotidyltransferase